MATLLITDADFLAAEREIAQLRAERKTLDASIKTLVDATRHHFRPRCFPARDPGRQATAA